MEIAMNDGPTWTVGAPGAKLLELLPEIRVLGTPSRDFDVVKDTVCPKPGQGPSSVLQLRNDGITSQRMQLTHELGEGRREPSKSSAHSPCSNRILTIDVVGDEKRSVELSRSIASEVNLRRRETESGHRPMEDYLTPRVIALPHEAKNERSTQFGWRITQLEGVRFCGESSAKANRLSRIRQRATANARGDQLCQAISDRAFGAGHVAALGYQSAQRRGDQRPAEPVR
jgi:hypothetical protein